MVSTPLLNTEGLGQGPHSFCPFESTLYRSLSLCWEMAKKKKKITDSLKLGTYPYVRFSPFSLVCQKAIQREEKGAWQK